MKPYPKYKDSKVEWIGNIPVEWDVKKLKYLAKILNGRDHKDVWDENGKYPIIGSGGVFGYANDCLHNGPSVLLGRKGTIDKPQYIDTPFWSVDTAFYTDIYKITNPRFFYYLCTTINFDLYKYGSAVPSMTQEVLNQIPFSAPTLVEQQSISSYLDRKTGRIDELIQKKRRMIELLKEERTAVINNAVTKGLDPKAKMKYSGIEWLGEVPAHWSVKRIKWIAKLESGHTPDKKKSEYWTDCNIPWVSLNDSKQLAVNDYISETAFCVNELGLQNSSARLLPERAVVFTRDAAVGLAAITTRPMAVSQHLVAWLCGEEVIPEYLLYVFYAMVDELNRQTMGATIKTIGMPEVKQLVSPVPPVEEQETIISLLKVKLLKIGEGIKKKEALISFLQEYRTALISEVVTGKIDVRSEVSA